MQYLLQKMKIFHLLHRTSIYIELYQTDYIKKIKNFNHQLL